MDYEQKYKEICQELMSAYNTTSFIEVRRAIEKIHPELAESDDERIRNRIRLCLDECVHSDIIRDYERDECLAYLEKQRDEVQRQFNLGVQAGREEVMYEMEKEQKPTEDTAVQKAFVISKKDYTLEEKCDASDYADTILPTSITYGENDEEYKLHKIIEAAFIAGKQKEQKPLSTEETELNSISFLEQLGYTCIPPGAEQKPTNSEKPKEWSEEDEDFLKRAIWYVENPAPSVVKDTNLTLWLKSLPERFNLQSKQEWSEEDLQHKSWILECLADGKRTMPQYAEDFHAAYNWLKSIRPQPHWKPNDEQMKSLREAGYRMRTNEEFALSNRLVSLYYDLKKL